MESMMRTTVMVGEVMVEEESMDGDRPCRVPEHGARTLRLDCDSALKK